ncbi:MAG: alpha/beta hydrolase [Acidimicrobiales bacterium]
MHAQLHSDGALLECAGYFKVSGAALYTVLHEAPDPIARVLLVGPFASERHFAYHPWVRWARYLAARGIEVLRYDYRGVGESTGNFEEMDFDHWSEDVELLADWLCRRSQGVPLLLHGLEIGAILAGRIFAQGSGDALLLWSPPPHANQALRSSLMRWAGLEQLFESIENRRSAADYIRQLEQGLSIEVAGYQWSSSLWRRSFDFRLPGNLLDDGVAGEAYGRPVKVVKLGRQAAPLVKPYVGYDEVKDLSWLYASNFEWVAGALRISKEDTHERGH